MAGSRGPGDGGPGRGQLGNLSALSGLEPDVRVLTLLVAAVLLTACAERAGIGADPGPDSPVTNTPFPAPTGTGGALEVTPSPGLVDVRPQPWDRAQVVGSRRVRVEFYGGVEECEGLDHVDVEETADRVTITLFVGRVPEAEVCIEIAVLKSVTIEVEESVRGRDIVDGS